MNKSDIVGRMADRMGLSKSAAEGAVDTVLEAIAEALAKEEAVRIAGFGTFATRGRSARTGRNRRTGESVPIAASKAPSFKAGKALREAVNTGWKPAAADRVDDRDLRQRVYGESGAAFDLTNWPGEVEPVWSLLEPESAQALRAEPLAGEGAVHLAEDLTEAELAQSAFVLNGLVLLGEMGGGDALWMGTHGNLKMKSVTRLRTLMSWPGMEATEQFRAGRTYREQAIGELHLLRLVAEKAGLIRSSALWFELTPLGRSMLEPGVRGGLQASPSAPALNRAALESSGDRMAALALAVRVEACPDEGSGPRKETLRDSCQLRHRVVTSSVHCSVIVASPVVRVQFPQSGKKVSSGPPRFSSPSRTARASYRPLVCITPGKRRAISSWLSVASK